MCTKKPKSERMVMKSAKDCVTQMGVELVRLLIEVVPFLAESRRFMSRLQEIATLPLDVVDVRRPSRLRCRLKRLGLLPGSGSMTVI